MTSRRLFFLALLAIALAGCGDRSLMLSVDIASYLDPATTDISFGPVPVIPGGIQTGEQPLVADKTVNMLSSMNDVVEVENVELTLTTIADASRGSGVDTLRVYLSDSATDPRTTTPVLVQVLQFTAGQSDTVQSTLGSDPRVAALFTDKAMRMCVTTSLHGPASGDSLSGRLRITELDAVVIAARK
ncbi:MAG: hypothetical protein IPJ04_05870 [Candidatus Eisenbacteria bacterium]|jgi:hypothetical protein|nr:hypothetical protein [Candidatus Eisenbacteria bacterium]